ncbi:hypothetical protein Lesp02_00470 [Lentzea sp. NBRC 105346]|uniref:hypothetical protein n=1 Tax=Lentzea sp. NBRC 105346 TaxID=3032205 RepID=UPI0024A273F9|nr:hypothetical protein [Lentzea sp. NBRC 105346]GLZ27857.1 hypothetical protein Lesp02_00470 [Lentzea sp. NBRC 105346]
MPNSTRRTVTQWLLLCVLFLGVVGMHHVAMNGDMPPGHGMVAAAHEPHVPEHDPAPPPAHDMLHLCVAVLCAFASALLLTWLLLRSARPLADRWRSSSSRPRAPARPPPIGGRALLGSLCVLRL